MHGPWGSSSTPASSAWASAASASRSSSRTASQRSEEHTSELLSHVNLVCRLLLEKKKQIFDNALRDLAADLVRIGFRAKNIEPFSFQSERSPVADQSAQQTIATDLWD